MASRSSTDLVIGGRYRRHLGDLLFGVSRLGEFVQRRDGSFTAVSCPS